MSEASPPWGRRVLPWGVALLTFLLVLGVRRAGDWATFIHDEDAYVLQAQVFARGRLAAPPRPVPEAFEQFYVLGTPVTAGKYYPGQALAIAPFEAAGLRQLFPAVTAAATAGLLAHLVLGLAGVLPALAAWLAWLAGDKVLTWHSSFLSQPTSALCWLVAIAAALAWRRRPGPRPLLVLGLALAFDALVRPWSAVLLAASLGPGLAAALTRARAWRQAVPALVAGCAIVTFLPVFNRAVTGDAATSPLALYTRTTMPYDRLGFGHADPPPRPLPEDHVAFHAVMRDSFAAFTPSRAPTIAATRARRVAQLLSGAPVRLPLMLAAIVAGLAWGGAAARRLLWPALALHVGYSAYAFSTSWNGYDLEAAPLWAAIAALGCAAAAERLAARHPAWGRRLLPAFLLATGADFAVWGAQAAAYARHETFPTRAFHAALDALARRHPEGLVVYVRYADGHDVHRSVVVNPPFVADAPVWVVHAIPATNRAVLAKAGARTPVLAQELPDRTWRLEVAPRPSD